MDEPAPAGYYYQPPGGAYAQYIGNRIPSDFQLPPMPQHYPDPNSQSPMPGFYHFDNLGNPPEYLGINPPKSSGYRRQNVPSTTSHSSVSRNAPPYSGEVVYSYTDASVSHYLVPQESYANSTQSDHSRAPPRISSTNESSSEMDYIPPFNTRPAQGYGGTQNDPNRFRTEHRESYQNPHQAFNPGVQRNGLQDTLPVNLARQAYATRDHYSPDGYEDIASTQSGRSVNQDQGRMQGLQSSHASNQSYKTRDPSGFTTEHRESYQHPQQAINSPRNVGASSRGGNVFPTARQAYATHDIPAGYEEMGPTQSRGSEYRDQGRMQGTQSGLAENSQQSFRQNSTQGAVRVPGHSHGGMRFGQ